MTGRLLTRREKADIMSEAWQLYNAGKEDEAMALFKTVPMLPWLAKVMKEKVGVGYLIQEGWNLTEAEAKFGQGWLAW